MGTLNQRQRTNMWNLIADCEQWMMNMKANSVLWCLICKLCTAKLVYRTVRWTLQVKYTLAIMPDQPRDTETEVQMRWKKGQNEELGALWRRLWDHQARLRSSKWSHSRFTQFRSSILGTFWPHFGTYFVCFLQLIFFIISNSFWDRFGGPSQLQKLAFC